MRLVITEAVGENKDMTPVALTQHDDIGQAITRALGYLEVELLIRGKVVAVKPNDTWASEQDKTAVTQADTLRAVLQYIKPFGPKELIVSGGVAIAISWPEHCSYRYTSRYDQPDHA